MSNTLIVRDATLAINGAPETRGDPHANLQQRIVDVQHMDAASVDSCFDVLNAVVGSGEEVDVEVLEALTILGLAHPQQAENLGVSAIAAGRRLAARREQTGESEYAMAVLETLLDVHPAEPSLERDYTAIMRRQGMVQDLVQRYLGRANGLLRQGKDQEAAGWLREAMLLDGSRKDIARKLRNLGLRGGRPGRSSFRPRPVIVAFVLIVGLAALVYRENRLREKFMTLPQVQAGELESARQRLRALEAFVDENLVWHGFLGAVSERSALRAAVDRLEEEAAVRRQLEERHRRDREEEAQLVRARGLMRVDSGNLEGALEDFERAVALASPEWSEHERTKRDIVAITEYLAGNQ